MRGQNSFRRLPFFAATLAIALVAPARTPAPVVERLARTVGEVLQVAETRRWEQLVKAAQLEKQ